MGIWALDELFLPFAVGNDLLPGVVVTLSQPRGWVVGALRWLWGSFVGEWLVGDVGGIRRREDYFIRLSSFTLV